MCLYMQQTIMFYIIPNLKVLDILFRQSGFIAHHELKTGVQFFAVGLPYMSVCIFLDVCAYMKQTEHMYSSF